MFQTAGHINMISKVGFDLVFIVKTVLISFNYLIINYMY